MRGDVPCSCSRTRCPACGASEDCAPRMAKAMGWTADEAASLLGAVLPTLRRWYGGEAR